MNNYKIQNTCFSCSKSEEVTNDKSIIELICHLSNEKSVNYYGICDKFEQAEIPF